MQQYLLTILILLPVAGALAVAAYAAMPNRRETHYRVIALLFAVLNFALSLFLMSGDDGAASFRIEQ